MGHPRDAAIGMRPVSEVAHQAVPDGATLLLEAPAEFVDGPRVKGDGSAFSPSTFSLASVVPNSTPPRDNQPKDKARVAACLLSLVLLLGLTSTDVTELLTISIALGFFLVSIKCITVQQAWRSIKLPAAITIAASFGLASALENTHVSTVLAVYVRDLAVAAEHPLLFLLIVFTATSVMSCCLNNSATVVLLFSVLKSVDVKGLRGQQVMLALLIGKLGGLISPISNGPNLMVYKAAPYVFSDFAALGSAMALVAGVLGCLAIYLMPEAWLP